MDTAQAEQRYFATNDGGSIAADVWPGPHEKTVLLVHGGGQTRHAWGQTAKLLSQSGWRAVALDLRGHGQSSWHKPATYELDVFVEDLVRVVEQLGCQPAYVGASLGGIVGMIAQGEHADGLFSALSLVDIAVHAEADGVQRILKFMSENLNDGFASLDEVADAIENYMPQRKRPQDLRGLEKNLRREDDGRYYWHWDPAIVEAATRYTDISRLEKAAHNLNLPLQLIRGRMSDVVSEEGVKKFLKMAPHAHYVNLEDAGHMVAGDKNDAFTAEICTFLSSLSIS